MAEARDFPSGRGPHKARGSPERYDLYTTREEHLELKQRLKEEGRADALRYDTREASRGPYIDLAQPGAEGLDLSRFDPFRSEGAKRGFEARMANYEPERRADRATVRAEAVAERSEHLPLGHEKRIDLYPTRDENRALKDLMAAMGAAEVLRWNGEERAWYLDMTRANAGKVDLSKLAPYRTEIAKEAFEKERARTAVGEKATREARPAVGEEAARARAERLQKIPAEEREWASLPLLMPVKGSPGGDKIRKEMLEKMTSAVLYRFETTERAINNLRERERLLKADGKKLDDDSRSRLVAMLGGRQVLREDLVGRGLYQFDLERRNALAGKAREGRAAGERSRESGAAQSRREVGAQQTVAASKEKPKAAEPQLSEAARLAMELTRGRAGGRSL